jgi:hypothetical protein
MKGTFGIILFNLLKLAEPHINWELVEKARELHRDARELYRTVRLCVLLRAYAENLSPRKPR